MVVVLLLAPARRGRAVAGLFCVTNETTGRVLDGLKLRENQEVATVVAEVGGVGSWSMDLATMSCSLSARMAALVVLPSEPTTMPASVWRERVPVEDLGLVETRLGASISDGSPYDVEFRLSLDPNSIPNRRCRPRGFRRASTLYG